MDILVLALAFVIMFVTGAAVLVVARRRTTGDTMQVDTRVRAHDMRYFAIACGIAMGAAFPPNPTTRWTGRGRGGPSRS